MTSRGAVIAWMPYNQRSQSLARALGLEIVLLGRRGYRRPWTAPFAYPVIAARTIGYLVRRRPRAVILVAPPFLLPLIAVPVARMFGAAVVIDVHSGALMDRRWRWSEPILRFAARRSDAVIVTLPTLAARFGPAVESVLLPAPFAAVVDELTSSRAAATTGSDRVVAICGWGDDEPLEELVEAARGEPWSLVMTGRQRRPLDLLPNASLSGFLSQAEFLELLSSAAAIVVLTTREETTLSGVWEALTLGRPLVTSGTASLRAILGEDVIYVEPRADSIRDGVRRALADRRRAADVSTRIGRRVRNETLERIGRVRTILRLGDRGQSS